MRDVKSNNLQKTNIDELSKLLQEICFLKKRTTDAKAQRDYDIYARDIQRFLKKAAYKVLTSEEIQVYIDDYQGVVQNAKVNNHQEKSSL
jgi:hypothetical protein